MAETPIPGCNSKRMSGSARVKTEKGVGGTQVPAPVEGAKSDLAGTAQTPSITYGGKSCHV